MRVFLDMALAGKEVVHCTVVRRAANDEPENRCHIVVHPPEGILQLGLGSEAEVLPLQPFSLFRLLESLGDMTPPKNTGHTHLYHQVGDMECNRSGERLGEG